MEEEEDQQLEKRWASLKPLRELSENMNIHIADILEEYLVDLSGIGDINFAEAALIIQGSVGVYSRKVEHVASLFNHTVELLFSNKKANSKKQAISINEDGVDTDIVKEDEPELLDLDDAMSELEAKNIYKTGDDLFDETMMQENQIAHPAMAFAQAEGQEDEHGHFHHAGAALESGAFLFAESGDFLSVGAMPSYILEEQDSSVYTSVPDMFPTDAPDFEMGGNNFPDLNQQTAPDNDDSVEEGLDNFTPGEDAELVETEHHDAQAGETGRYKRDPKPKKAAQDIQYWKHYDPHPITDVPVKPLKKGKTFKIPPPLINKDKPLAKAPAERKKNPLLTMFCDEFQYLLDADLKKRRQRNTSTVVEKISKVTGAAPEPRFEQTILLPDESEDGEDDSEEENQLNVPAIGSVNSMPDQFWGSIESGMANLTISSIDKETMTAKRNDEMTSYDDYCKSYFEQYLNEAKQYALETDQSRRVENWKARLTPLLTEQDKRPSFQIHAFSTKFLNKFPAKDAKTDLGAKVQFKKLVTGKEPWEVCRAFVATLHMVNAGNLNLDTKRDHVNGNDLIECTLLSRETATDIEDFEAPSKSIKPTKATTKKQTKKAEPNSDEEESEPPAKRTKPVKSTNGRKGSKGSKGKEELQPEGTEEAPIEISVVEEKAPIYVDESEEEVEAKKPTKKRAPNSQKQKPKKNNKRAKK